MKGMTVGELQRILKDISPRATVYVRLGNGVVVLDPSDFDLVHAGIVLKAGGQA